MTPSLALVNNKNPVDDTPDDTIMVEVAMALTAPGRFDEALTRAARSTVRQLDAAMAQIWTVDRSQSMVDLRVSAGLYQHRNGPHGHLPLESSWIGRVTHDQRPQSVRPTELDDPDLDWAVREGLSTVCAYPLLIDGRSLGTLVVYWRRAAPSGADRTLAAVARLLALALERNRLEVSSRLLTEILDSTSDLVTVGPVDGPPVHINMAARRALGLGPNEHVESLLEFRLPGFDLWQSDEILPAAERDGSWRGESDYVTRDGDVIHVSEVLVAHHNSDGHSDWVSTVARNITAEAAEREEARRSEERTRFALEAARAGVWENDLRAGRVIWSETMRAVQGFATEEFSGTFDSFRALIHPDDRDALDRVMNAIFSDPGDFKLKFRTLWADGTTHWVETHGRVLADATGRPARVMGMAQDVTARETLEEQLRQVQKMEAVGQLAGGVAHDFNNLLTVILSYGDLLAEQIDASDPRRADVEEIQRAGHRAAQLTRQLLAFSRKQVMRPTVLILNDLVTDASRMIGRLIGAHIDLVLHLQPSLQPIKADAGQVEQILVNLAVNARDAMAGGGTLSIRTTTEDLDDVAAARASLPGRGRYVSLIVGDTGVGMSEATRKRIFEPFFTTKERGKGTGLGLATVFGIVAQSGGTIDVHSEPGRGTTFRMLFPAAAAAAIAAPAVSAPQAVPAGTEVVLLVEDDDAVRTLARVSLERLGYRVLSASTPAEALAVAASSAEAIHLLLTDVVLPGSSGPDLYVRLHAARPALRVLFVSGFGHDTVACQTVLETGVPFLSKPFTCPDLARKVREVLDDAGH